MAKWIPSSCALWCSWLRRCGTSRRVMGSILNGVIRISFRPHYGPAVDSAPNRIEYQGYFLGCKGGRCLGLRTLPPSCADCLEIWEFQTPRTLKACPALYRDFLWTCSTIASLYFFLMRSQCHVCPQNSRFESVSRFSRRFLTWRHRRDHNAV